MVVSRGWFSTSSFSCCFLSLTVTLELFFKYVQHMYRTILISEIFSLVAFGKKKKYYSLQILSFLLLCAFPFPASQEKWVREKGMSRYLHTAIFQGSQIWTHKIFDWFCCSRHSRIFVFKTSWCSFRWRLAFRLKLHL